VTIVDFGFEESLTAIGRSCAAREDRNQFVAFRDGGSHAFSRDHAFSGNDFEPDHHLRQSFRHTNDRHRKINQPIFQLLR
jgi:hypothetical protein